MCQVEQDQKILEGTTGGTCFCSASCFFDNFVIFCTYFDYYKLIYEKLASSKFHLVERRNLQK